MLKQIPFWALLLYCGIAQAQCDVPLTSLNEDFQTFEQSSFPQNCWTSSNTQTSINDWYADGNLAAFLLVGPGSQTPSYLVSPALTADEAHTITFEASGIGTLQIGILSTPDGFEDFVPLANFDISANKRQYHAITPVMQSAWYIAFKLIPASVTSHVLVDNVTWPSPLACEVAVDSFLEDFSSFEMGGASQNCWVGSSDENYMYVTGTTARAVILYCEPVENVEVLYLVSPKISDLTGSHTLRFRASGADGLYQIGTMASGYDFSSFIPVGEPIPTVAQQTDYSAPVTGPDTHHYVALKFTVAPDKESSISMLRYVALDESLSIPDNNTKNLTVYPNPTQSILNISGISGVAQAIVFDISGREILRSTGNQVDVSGIANGVYVLYAEGEDGNRSVRFVKE